MTAEQMLQELESRADALLQAERQAGEAELAFKAFEATASLAFRDAGSSMAEAERRVKTEPAWGEAFGALQAAHLEAASRKRAYARAERALDLWRTEQTTLRQV
tara:strand:+ start:404 stop:715 length:312 start_codon:yes stop_codon:yes gene_type:complete